MNIYVGVGILAEEWRERERGNEVRIVTKIRYVCIP